jgi:hypothetical protein
VGDALAVRRLQHVQQLKTDAGRPHVVERALLGEEFAQRRAVDPLGHDPQGAVLLHGVDDARHRAGTQHPHRLGHTDDAGGGAQRGFALGVRWEVDLGEQIRTLGSAVDGLAVPADPVRLAVDDVDEPIPSGNQLVCEDMRLDHGHPSLNPWLSPFTRGTRSAPVGVQCILNSPACAPICSRAVGGIPDVPYA